MNKDNDIINTNIDPAANTFAYGVEVDYKQKELLLKIGNGQLPNPPSSFEVDNNNFTLWTYKGPEDNTLKNSTLMVTKE